jgi:hypothetical protein
MACAVLLGYNRLIIKGLSAGRGVWEHLNSFLSRDRAAAHLAEMERAHQVGRLVTVVSTAKGQCTVREALRGGDRSGAEADGVAREVS